MADKKHLAILKKGVAAWNDSRKQHRDIGPDLGGADLSVRQTIFPGFDRHHGPPLAGFAVSGFLCLRRMARLDAATAPRKCGV